LRFQKPFLDQPFLMEGDMRVSSFSLFIVTAVLLAGCGPEDRPVEFYIKAENAAEFAHALEICRKSGLSQKGKCASVWQAKAKMDIAEDKAMVERAGIELPYMYRLGYDNANCIVLA
jgi:hypothetical protein